MGRDWDSLSDDTEPTIVDMLEATRAALPEARAVASAKMRGIYDWRGR